MSDKLPRVTAREVLRALQRDGWHQVRQHGSHVQLKHPTKPGRVTVAIHSGRIVPVGILNNIMDAAGLSVGEFTDLL